MQVKPKFFAFSDIRVDPTTCRVCATPTTRAMQVTFIREVPSSEMYADLEIPSVKFDIPLCEDDFSMDIARQCAVEQVQNDAK